MSTPFAAIEARATAAVFRRLSNAQAVIAGGEPLGVVFDAFREDVDEHGVLTRRPSMLMPATMAIAEGMAVAVDGISYITRGAPQIAEGGMRRVTLARS